MAQNVPHIYSHGQLATLRATCDSWQDKYDRLLEAHKRLQKVNQGLEDKLLRLVDRSESEKVKLSQEITNLTTALTTAAQAINRLKNENVRSEKDLSLAIQLLQCNPAQYASHKLDMLPSELHQKIKSHLAPEPPKTTKSDVKVIRVPIPTFPPTAMVYSVNKCSEEKEEEEPVDVVSAAILAAILEERERERSKKHCPTCTCVFDTKRNLNPSVNSSDAASYNNIDSSKFTKTIFYSESKHKLEPHEDEGEKYVDKSNKEHISVPFNVNAIDIGTQTLPSYIGETGKVTATCIYCQSIKTLSELNIHNIEVSSDNSLSSSYKKTVNSLTATRKSLDPKSEGKISSTIGNCSWDWHTESQDSGSPSTPTSFTSASLSFESETSCFTSPQDSPGHYSLQNANTNYRGSGGHDNVSGFINEGKTNCLSEDGMILCKKFKISKPSRYGPFNNSSHISRNSVNCILENSYTMKKTGGKPVFDTGDSIPYRIPSNNFQGLDSFTPVHSPPSERLSSSDSDVISGGSNSPTACTEFSTNLGNKNSLKNYPHLEVNECVSTLGTNIAPVNDVLPSSDIFLKDTYFSNNDNFKENNNITNESENLVVVSSTYTSSATETTL